MNKFNFKDFAIKPKGSAFVGDKIKANYLKLQIEKAGDKRVVFTGSKVLTDQIEQVPREKFPFETTITGDNERYEFT